MALFCLGEDLPAGPTVPAAAIRISCAQRSARAGLMSHSWPCCTHSCPFGFGEPHRSRRGDGGRGWSRRRENATRRSGGARRIRRAKAAPLLDFRCAGRPRCAPAECGAFASAVPATIMDGRVEASGCNRRRADGTSRRGDRPVGRPSPRYRSWAVSTISTVSDLSARRRPRTRLLPDQRMGFLRRTG